MRWKRTDKSRRRVRKPSFLLLTLGYLYGVLFFAPRYRVQVDRRGLADLHGPALVLAPHLSGKDHILLGLALYPHRPTFVLSLHFMTKRLLRPVLTWMQCISKKMFYPDLSTIVKVMRAKESGHTIVLFPEGRLPCVAVSDPVAGGTAQLVKKLGIDVYCVHADGAALSFPKWGQARRGKIRVSCEKLLCGADAAGMELSALDDLLAKALAHDDEARMDGVSYHCSAAAEGLQNVLHRCPLCGTVGTLQTKGDSIFCTCGMHASLSPQYRLDGVPFTRVSEWYRWQGEQIDLSKPLQTHVRLAAADDDGWMCYGVGEGTAYLDRERFCYDGTLFGEELHFTVSTDRVGAFPLTVGRWFDCYMGGRLCNFYPDDGQQVALWSQYLDEIHRRNKEKAAGQQPR